MRIGCIFLFFVTILEAQSFERNEITFSIGHSREIDSQSFKKETALGLGATYSYRLLRNFAIDAGVFAALSPAPEIRGAYYDIVPSDRFIWVPFGVRGILPMRNDRFELSLGGGGLYEKYSVSNENPGVGLVSRSGWGGYFAGAAAVSLDPHRRFWLGFKPQIFIANPRDQRDRWLMLAGEVSYRF
jgi:hypothetical protein